jgi:hypothetical protein
VIQGKQLILRCERKVVYGDRRHNQKGHITVELTRRRDFTTLRRTRLAATHATAARVQRFVGPARLSPLRKESNRRDTLNARRIRFTEWIRQKLKN